MRKPSKLLARGSTSRSPSPPPTSLAVFFSSADTPLLLSDVPEWAVTNDPIDAAERRITASTKLSLEPAPGLWGVDWSRFLGRGRAGGTCGSSPDVSVDVNTEDGAGEGGRAKVVRVGEAELGGDADDVHVAKLAADDLGERVCGSCGRSGVVGPSGVSGGCVGDRKAISGVWAGDIGEGGCTLTSTGGTCDGC